MLHVQFSSSTINKNVVQIDHYKTYRACASNDHNFMKHEKRNKEAQEIPINSKMDPIGCIVVAGILQSILLRYLTDYI